MSLLERFGDWLQLVGSEFFTLTILGATLAAAIRLAVPYLIAGLGETIGQRSGVLNLGVDGVMLLSAFGSFYMVLKQPDGVWIFPGMWMALAVGVAIGFLMGIVYGVVTEVFKAAQGISGIGIYLFGLGFSDLLFREWVGGPKPIRQLPKYGLPGIESENPGLLARVWDFLQTGLFNHNLVTYFAFLMVPMVWFLVQKTTFGMNIRAVGENPQAADSLGVSVGWTRFFAILIGNTLAGLAGGALALELGIFQQNLTAGLGFVAVALVYFGAWRPSGVMGGALLYGVVAAIILQWKALGLIPRAASDLGAMAPALITIVALVVLAGRVRAPAALTRPFERH